jgi:hypothetical protein
VFLAIFLDPKPFLIQLIQLILIAGFPFRIKNIHPDIVYAFTTIQQFIIDILLDYVILFLISIKCFEFQDVFVFLLLQKFYPRFIVKIIKFFAALSVTIDSLIVNLFLILTLLQ